MLNRVFFEETHDYRRSEIGPYSIDGVAIEVDDPAVLSNLSWFFAVHKERHSSEWRGPRSYLVDGLERDPAPI